MLIFLNLYLSAYISVNESTLTERNCKGFLQTTVWWLNFKLSCFSSGSGVDETISHLLVRWTALLTVNLMEVRCSMVVKKMRSMLGNGATLLDTRLHWDLVVNKLISIIACLAIIKQTHFCGQPNLIMMLHFSSKLLESMFLVKSKKPVNNGWCSCWQPLWTWEFAWDSWL